VSKTVLVLTPMPPQALGGMEHLVRELIRGLEARGYRTEIFHRGNCEPTWLSKRRSPLGRKIAGTLLGYWIGRNAQKHMTRDVVAVISNSDVGYYPLRGASHVKRIHFHHGTYRGQSEAIRPFIKYTGYLYLKWWNSMVLERLSGRGKLTLTCSDQTSVEVSDFFAHESIAMWCPIDTTRFTVRDAAASRIALNLPKEATIGLFIGSVHPMKGFPIVQSLIARFPGIHWVLALRGGLPNAKAAMPNATILVDVPHDQIPLLCSAADFSVCPSLYEPFGYVVAEALACGTPVIASPGGASRLFLRDPPIDRLLVSTPEATSGFADAVREFLRDPEFYRRAVVEQVRPRLQEIMTPENWWRRFLEVTGL
jgi:glycosyltransferase involved in cell wall biosynthesis